MSLDVATLYPDKDIVVRREGTGYLVLRSRFSPQGQVIAKPELDKLKAYTTVEKIVILPELPNGAA